MTRTGWENAEKVEIWNKRILQLTTSDSYTCTKSFKLFGNLKCKFSARGHNPSEFIKVALDQNKISQPWALRKKLLSATCSKRAGIFGWAYLGFSNVCHSMCVWPTALKLGCLTNFDTLFLMMGFNSLVDKIKFMLISSRHFCAPPPSNQYSFPYYRPGRS